MCVCVFLIAMSRLSCSFHFCARMVLQEYSRMKRCSKSVERSLGNLRCHNVCSSENTFFEQQNDSSGAVLHMFEWMFLFFLCLDDDDDDDGK